MMGQFEFNSVSIGIYRGMLDAIFAILFRNDPKDIEILQTW